MYKETGQPVEWVMIDVTCLRTHLSRAERKELFEREKRKYDALITQGKQIPYQDFSDWTSEQFKTERSCGWRDFLHAEDGWITIPEISNVRMDSYEIRFDPAGGHTIYVVNPSRYNENPEKNYKLWVSYFDEKTFPKFAALPEKERVLEAMFTKQCDIPSGTLNPTYEEARFFLATYKIILNHWPELSAAGCGPGYGGGAPYFKSGYWGFLRYSCLLRMQAYTDPAWTLPGAKYEVSPAQRADLLERTRQLFCNDIKTKQSLWGETGVSPDLLELDFFRDLHCECMGVQGLPPCTTNGSVEMPKELLPSADCGAAQVPDQFLCQPSACGTLQVREYESVPPASASSDLAQSWAAPFVGRSRQERYGNERGLGWQEPDSGQRARLGAGR